MIDNNCVIIKISHCALDVLMAGALCQDQLLLLAATLFAPCNPCSPKQPTSLCLVGLGLLPICHSCWASGHLWQWFGSSDRMQKIGGAGSGKISDLQKVDYELCNCPFQAGMHWWTRNTAKDGNMQEHADIFSLLSIALWNSIAFGSNSKAQQSFGFAFGVCYFDIQAGYQPFFCYTYNDWMTLVIQKSLEICCHHCSS